MLTAVVMPMCLSLMVEIAAETSVFASGVVYRYLDQGGIVVYTDRWEDIPTSYRPNVERLDGDTLDPLAPPGTQLELRPTEAPLPTVPMPRRTTAPQEPWGVAAEWTGPMIRHARSMNFSLPSTTQLGIGLTAAALLAMALVALSVTRNRHATMIVRTLILFIIAGGAYVIFMTDLMRTQPMPTGQGHTPTSPRELVGAVGTRDGSTRADPSSPGARPNSVTSSGLSGPHARDRFSSTADQIPTQMNQAKGEGSGERKSAHSD
ncbi:MAG: hypothetical protein E8D45_06735 [Nitrospira sp.]|nr:MAG: hypothetical protein E8D45_06735 [Nitrospira sp.]